VKLGTENRRKTILAGVLAVIALVLVVRAFRSGGDETASSGTAPAATGRGPAKAARKPARTLLAHSLDPSLRFDLLKSSEEVTYKGTGRNIFRSEAPPPPIPQPLPPDKQPAAVNTPPPPPPIDLKFYGYAGPRGGNRQIFLLKGEDIFLAKEGQIIDRRYKILHINPTSVEVQDVLTNNTQTIPLTAG
jgi:hypothetical protein